MFSWKLVDKVVNVKIWGQGNCYGTEQFGYYAKNKYLETITVHNNTIQYNNKSMLKQNKHSI